MITVQSLQNQRRVAHAFFTREGGVSDGLFASLNCGMGSGDERARVAENRTRVAGSLGFDADRLVTCYQIHSPDVVVVEKPWTAADAPRADAMVSRQPGIVLGILTADCAPVLLADAEAGVIGAAHAGWRGAVTGVVEATVAAMEELGASRERVAAAIGPCIAAPSYEVGAEFPAPFLQQDPDNARFFSPGRRPDKRQFDLPGYLGHRLRLLGLGEVSSSGHDTQSDEALFFSYRRTTLRGEKDYGRLLSAIALRG